MKVTMQDVANRAGVDKATVSRVLRGDCRISEKTRAKVFESVRELHYKLDINARNLSTNRSGLVGVVIRDLSDEWTGAFLAGVDRAFANSEYEILLKTTEGNAARATREIWALYSRSADGVVWCDAENFPDVRFMPALCLGFTAEGAYSVITEGGGSPTFETGVLAGRMILNIISGKPLPAKEIRVVNTGGEYKIGG